MDDSNQLNLFKLEPLTAGFEPFLLTKKESMVGRAESCDLSIPNKFLSAVHSMLVVENGKVAIKDLGSTNGTIVNSAKTDYKVLVPGDIINFGPVQFRFEIFDPQAALNQSGGTVSNFQIRKTQINLAKKKSLPKQPGGGTMFSSGESGGALREVLTPRDIDPNIVYSEFLLEENQKIYDIFEKLDADEALEVLVLYGNHTIVLDYLLLEGGSKYYATSKYTESNNYVQVSSISNNKRHLLCKVEKNDLAVYPLPDHDVSLISKSKEKSSFDDVYYLGPGDIVQMTKGHFKILLKRVSSPYGIVPPPFFGRELSRIPFILSALIWIVASLVIHFSPVEKTIVKEEIPKKIQKILYKPKKKPKVVPKVKPKPKPKKADNKKAETKKPKKSPNKVKRKAPPKPKPAPVKKQVAKKPRRKPRSRVKSATRNNAKPKAAPKPVVKKTFKGFSFASKTLNTIGAKSNKVGNLSFQNVGTKKVGVQNFETSGGGKAQLNLQGGKVGRIDAGSSNVLGKGIGSGTQGVKVSKGDAFAGLYRETRLLGNIDKEKVYDVLKSATGQFRYCYVQDMERSGRKMTGSTRFNFDIDPRGRAVKIKVSSNEIKFTGRGKGCLKNVLAGLKFPRPKGGGSAAVTYPISFSNLQ